MAQVPGEAPRGARRVAHHGAHLAAEAQDDADSSDSDSESEDEEEQETHRSRVRGGASSAGSAEEKRGSLSPAGSRHSSGENLFIYLIF